MIAKHTLNMKIYFVEGVFRFSDQRKKENISVPNQQQGASYQYSSDDHETLVRYRHRPGSAVAEKPIFCTRQSRMLV